MRTADWNESISVLDRVTAVFDSFGDHDEGLGVSELARRANLPKSTVSRIAADLVAQRFLDREGDKLFLGVRLFELGQTVERPRRLRQVALPVMTDLRNQTGHTVILAVLEGADIVIVATVRGEAAPTPLARVGGRLPAHATALGKALLAFSPDGRDPRSTHHALSRCTAHTIRQPSEFLRELAGVRRNGVAVEREECAVGRGGVASPVLDYCSAAIAAIGVTGSVDELDPDRVTAAVRASAITLSHRSLTGRR